MSTELVPTPTPTNVDPSEVAHVFRAAEVREFAGTGTPITALCGHTQPVQGFITDTGQPKCEPCYDIVAMHLSGSPGSN